MTDPEKLYEAARKKMYDAMGANSRQKAQELFSEANASFSRFLQATSKSYGIYADLVSYFMLLRDMFRQALMLCREYIRFTHL
jgi:hypothetical protein